MLGVTNWLYFKFAVQNIPLFFVLLFCSFLDKIWEILFFYTLLSSVHNTAHALCFVIIILLRFWFWHLAQHLLTILRFPSWSKKLTCFSIFSEIFLISVLYVTLNMCTWIGLSFSDTLFSASENESHIISEYSGHSNIRCCVFSVAPQSEQLLSLSSPLSPPP